MKKLLFIFLTLTASVWSSFSYAQSSERYEFVFYGVRSGSSTVPSYNFTLSPDFGTPIAATNLAEALSGVSISWNRTKESCVIHANASFTCPTLGGGNSLLYTQTLIEESNESCADVAGEMIGFHSSASPFCANVVTESGKLLCKTECGQDGVCVGIVDGYLHYATAEKCDAVTGPDGGGEGPNPGNPDPDPNNPEPPETPDPNIPDSSGTPSKSPINITGTIGGSDGSVTNINMNMEQDFSPITNRQNESNSYLKAIERALRAQIDDAKKSATELKTSLNNVKDSIDKSAQETKQQLTDINKSIKDGFGGVGEKLDGISDGISGMGDTLKEIKDGFGTAAEGESSADDVTLPDYESLINEGYDKILKEIDSEGNTNKVNELTDSSKLGERLKSLNTLSELFKFSADHCEPIHIARDYYFDLCPYAPRISSTLSFIAVLLTVLFLLRSFSDDLKRLRV